MEERILLVEDEEALRVTLADRLQSENYTVECASDGEEGLQKALENRFDLILLDVMLPRKKGFDICRDLRKAGLVVPIIMLTARTETVDKVLGLKIGADDYVTKPFQMIELMARVEALLRRVPRQSTDGGHVHQFGRLRIDLRGTSVTRDGQVVPLSAREFQLLRYFIEHQGTTLSREVLLKDVWGYSADAFTRTVDVHVASLRQKLEEDSKKPALFVTVLGLGYKFARQA
ncbi:MAG: two component transcriptional regulator, winged helix family [Acidobacteriaceae bacterium]|nr:two component transcriptional regulator, winged helix family [Acidobacteriaceae bacterium]